ncbi:MAG: type II toxin-antitoxin system prevent-host-death family antitoxin [Alphaproteobacteria bacterium]|nr:type II toxin-antitoxin system prevent-host-death family antitoxin [Alphaproteobacteria bacterium]
MMVVDILEAKSNLSRLVDAVESGAEAEIVIARNGRPAAKLVAVRSLRRGRRLGVAKGKFKVPGDIDANNAVIAQMLAGGAK